MVGLRRGRCLLLFYRRLCWRKWWVLLVRSRPRCILVLRVRVGVYLVWRRGRRSGGAEESGVRLRLLLVGRSLLGRRCPRRRELGGRRQRGRGTLDCRRSLIGTPGMPPFVSLCRRSPEMGGWHYRRRRRSPGALNWLL